MTEYDTKDALFQRSGLPDDLLFLLRKYPRDRWGQDITLTDMCQFWIQRHDMFRELGNALSDSVVMLREEKVDPASFRQWFAPRVNFLLSQLEGHHHIEDTHYFPSFQAAEPRLKRGFEILDADHHTIHDLLVSNADAGNAFLKGLAEGGDALKFASEKYGREADRLLAGLMRHLEDEEDLIVPLLVDREGMGQVLM